MSKKKLGYTCAICGKTTYKPQMIPLNDVTLVGVCPRCFDTLDIWLHLQGWRMDKKDRWFKPTE